MRERKSVEVELEMREAVRISREAYGDDSVSSWMVSLVEFESEEIELVVK